jgi:hypothetical protein
MAHTEPEGASDQGTSLLGDVLRDLFRNAFDLVRDEVQLASREVGSEMSRKVSKTFDDSRLVAIGAFVVFAGFLLILVAAVTALSVFIPTSCTALAVGVTTLLAGAITMRSGKKRLSEDNPITGESVHLFEEDTTWMRNHPM